MTKQDSVNTSDENERKTDMQNDWTKPAAMAIPEGGFFKDKVEQGRYGPMVRLWRKARRKTVWNGASPPSWVAPVLSGSSSLLRTSGPMIGRFMNSATNAIRSSAPRTARWNTRSPS